MMPAIHGDKQQNERDWVLNEFKTGKSPIMVATDVASRGIGMLECVEIPPQPSPFPPFWTLCKAAYDAVLSSSWVFLLTWLGFGTFLLFPSTCRVTGCLVQRSIVWSLASRPVSSETHFRFMETGRDFLAS